MISIPRRTMSEDVLPGGPPKTGAGSIESGPWSSGKADVLAGKTECGESIRASREGGGDISDERNMGSGAEEDAAAVGLGLAAEGDLHACPLEAKPQATHA